MLRGINVGGNRRVPMAELRALLTDAGLEDVATYVQSGNVVLTTEHSPSRLATEVGSLVAQRFGFAVDVVCRTGEELAAVIARDPLGEVAVEPKRYQVSFCERAVADDVRATLERAAVAPERIAFDGREIYAWHPDGVARSKLWNALAGRGLGVVATARNWTTVTTLARMASDAGSA